MAGSLRTGQIVWAEIADANGISKDRPVVIVTPDERITSTGTIEVIAITSRIANPMPDDHVLLPWYAQGHPRTGLNRKSAAVCSWIRRISVTDIKSVGGLVSGATLEEILAKVATRMSPP